MIAPRVLPTRYAEWNARHSAPFGRRGKERLIRLLRSRPGLAARYVGPYGWQPNSNTRSFEYPWAYEQVNELGDLLRIVEIGGSLSGLQFTLARLGHEVHNVDPGMAPGGAKQRLGWDVDPNIHGQLTHAYRAPVTLHPTTLAGASLTSSGADVLLSISTIEHFSNAAVDELVAETRRVLKPGGHLIFTVDLFLDIAPFTSEQRNPYGTNVNIAELLTRMGAELSAGDPSELHGFPEFEPERIQRRLSEFMIGTGYPSLAQCFVARIQVKR